MIYKATVEVFVAVNSEGEACDAIAEALRPLLREFAGPESCWIDWRYAGNEPPVEAAAAEIVQLEFQA